MPLDRDEIAAALQAAYQLDADDGGPGGEVYVEAMRSVVADAEAYGDPALLFEARLALAWALRSMPLRGGPWDGSSDFFSEVLPLLRRCLLSWHDEPHLFPEGNVQAMWNQLFLVVDAYNWLFPAPARRILGLLDELERCCPPTRRWTRYAIDHYRMDVEARRGDVDAVEQLWHRLRAQGVPDDHFKLAGKASMEAVMWERLGRDDRAIETLAPVLAGQVAAAEGENDEDNLLMPYVRAGRLTEAVAVHQRNYARPGLKVPAVASHLRFCALTGNEERGLEVLHRNLDYFRDPIADVEKMWLAAAATLLCRRVVETDTDREWIWPCSCGPDCDHTTVWSYAAFGSQLHWEVVGCALSLDDLNGTTFQSERIEALLAAEPVLADLTLPPSTSDPRHRAVPPLPPSPSVTATTGDQLRSQLAQARTMERPRDRIRLLQRLLHHALATDETDESYGLGGLDLVADIRLALLDDLASQGTGWWRFSLFSTLAELVRLHHAQPSLFSDSGRDRMWRAVPIALDRVLTFPTVHAAQIRSILRLLEPQCRPGTDDLHHIRWFRVELEVRRGDHDAARAAWAAFDDLPPTGVYHTVTNFCRRTRWWLDLRLDDDAIETMAPLLAGDLSGEENGLDREDYLLLPYLRAGMFERARQVHERGWGTAREAPEVAAHLDYCAHIGDLDRGRELLHRSLDLFHFHDDLDCSIDSMRVYAAALRLNDRILAAGIDGTWTWPGSTCCPPEDNWSYARLAEEFRSYGDFYITRWDGLMGGHGTRAL